VQIGLAPIDSWHEEGGSPAGAGDFFFYFKNYPADFVATTFNSPRAFGSPPKGVGELESVYFKLQILNIFKKLTIFQDKF
jgi:hypothetical protein